MSGVFLRAQIIGPRLDGGFGDAASYRYFMELVPLVYQWNYRNGGMVLVRICASRFVQKQSPNGRYFPAAFLKASIIRSCQPGPAA